MNVALIGATGNAGARILAELTRRGHAVTAIVRDTSEVPALPGVTGKAGEVRASGVSRHLVVGGAGSLEVAPGLKVIDTPEVPPECRDEAAAGGVYLDPLRGERNLDWTFLSPSAMFVPGERTGTFRLGTDDLLVNEQGSSISFEDYATALVDELETPAHSRRRFTVGY